METSNSNAMIFGVGLPRTGTRSLARAMQLLGYKTKHYSTRGEWIQFLKGNRKGVDFIVDLPVPLYIDSLLDAFPRAKFIHTTRSIETWLPSIKKLFARHGWNDSQDWSHWRAQLFGWDDRAPELLRIRAAHEEKVRSIGYRRDLLILDLERGDGWAKLAPFVGVPAPTVPFPHEGKSYAIPA